MWCGIISLSFSMAHKWKKEKRVRNKKNNVELEIALEVRERKFLLQIIIKSPLYTLNDMQMMDIKLIMMFSIIANQFSYNEQFNTGNVVRMCNQLLNFHRLHLFIFKWVPFFWLIRWILFDLIHSCFENFETYKN